MKKKFLAALLALCMSLALLPGMALAAGDPGGLDAAPNPSALTDDGDFYDPSTETGGGPLIVDFTEPAGIMPYADTETEPGKSSARYTVMVLDCSGSMSGIPMERMKEAAKLFCQTVTKAAGQNYVAIVPFESSLRSVTEFTQDLSVLEAAIDTLYASGGTNLNEALLRAGSLLRDPAIPEDAYLRNVLLLSDGLPQSGMTSETGSSDVTYTSADDAGTGYYRYANACLQTAEGQLWPEYRVYTLGFLHSVNGQLKKFCTRFLDDLANGAVGGTYVEVTNPDDLSFIFGTDIAGDLTDDPTVSDEDPIIVIPGIMGSKLYSDPECATQVWPALDPSGLDMSYTLYAGAIENQNHTGSREYGANNTYQDLVDRLCDRFPGREVYFFNYDWRQSSAAAAAGLANAIDTLLSSEPADTKFDLVGHSMGALVAARYYQTYGGSKVDKIISCAAPFEGSPEAITQAVNGSLSSLARTFPSVAELAPSDRHIRFTTGNRDSVFTGIFGAAYDSGTQSAGAFQALLNYPASYFISGTGSWTITAMELSETNGGGSVTDLRYSRRGDGTVPYSSASPGRATEELASSRRLAFPASHNEVVTNRNCLNWITNVLRNGNGIGSSTTSHPAGITVVRVACPVDVTVTLGSETLSASSPETSFGRMDLIGENNDIKMLCLDAGIDYSVNITTNDQYVEGDTMDVAVRYYDGDGFFERESAVENKALAAVGQTFGLTVPADETGTVLLDGDVVPVNRNLSSFITGDPLDVSRASKPESEETYYIAVSDTSNGEVIPNVRYAAEGERVTLSAHPGEGCKLDRITVTDTRGREITLKNLGDGRYSFTMPARQVTVTAVFAAAEDTTGAGLTGTDHTNQKPNDQVFTGLGTPGISGIVLNPSPMTFSDVNPGDWFYDNVDYVWKHYLMSGVSETQFSPNTTTSRGMIWTVLARMNNVRTDLNPGATWYEKGMLWAIEQGVTDGSNAMGEITREQLATMLWRNAGKPGGSGDLSAFSDSDSVSGYAASAVRWAIGVGILNGSDGKINPQGTATRAQVAAMVARYGDKVAAR